MTTVVRGPRPPELESFLERRRRSGSDRLDEVWEGTYVVAPDPHSAHGEAAGELRALLKPHARRLGLRATQTFNLGDPDDYRIPDAGLVPRPSGVWHASAVLVVEVLSPDDMTFDKLDFYTAPASSSCSSRTGRSSRSGASCSSRARSRATGPACSACPWPRWSRRSTGPRTAERVWETGAPLTRSTW